MSQEEVQNVQDVQDVQDVQSSRQTHKMSIGVTIGGTIGLIGLVLLLYGLFGNADYSHSDGININLWWGLLMVVFGLVMGGGSFLVARAKLSR